MPKVRVVPRVRLAILLSAVILGAASSRVLWAQAHLENPTSRPSQGGKGEFTETFRNPPEITSAGGVLNVTLIAAPQEIDIAGKTQ